jgi:hypothetical protein
MQGLTRKVLCCRRATTVQSTGKDFVTVNLALRQATLKEVLK